MVKKQKQQHFDDKLFRQEMSGVIPLKTTPVTDSKAPRNENHKIKLQDFAETMDMSNPNSVDSQTSIDAEDGSTHRKNGIQNRTMQRLKRGRFNVGAELDLHSLTLEKGRTALMDFLATAQSESLESVRVIHGKGLRSENGPRMKLMARQLLRDHSQVLAYTSCKPADGGDGAVDVLLKSS